MWLHWYYEIIVALMWKSGDKKSFSYSLLSHLNNTRKSRCLAGEPKHFPFAIVFILKSSLTCSSCWKKLFFWRFLDDFGLFLEICVIKNVKIRCSVITSSVYLTKLFFCHEYFYSYNRNIEKRVFSDDFCLCFVICAQKIRCAVILSSVFLTKLFFYH